MTHLNTSGAATPCGSTGDALHVAHERVHRIWPGTNAPPARVIAYHEQAARIYEQVAMTDPRHQHEAHYLAQQEHDDAETARREAEPEVSPCRTA